MLLSKYLKEISNEIQWPLSSYGSSNVGLITFSFLLQHCFTLSSWWKETEIGQTHTILVSNQIILTILQKKTNIQTNKIYKLRMVLATAIYPHCVQKEVFIWAFKIYKGSSVLGHSLQVYWSFINEVPCVTNDNPHSC